MKKLILFNGGESREHQISLGTCAYLKKILEKLACYEIYEVFISRRGQWTYEGVPCHVTPQQTLETQNDKIPIDGAIPFLHGHPSETGALLALLEIYKIPYLGPGHEAAVLSFNKMSTKYWVQSLEIPVCPALVMDSWKKNKEKAHSFFHQYGPLFIKASSQGSSIGCYFVDQEEQLEEAVQKSLALSPYGILEKAIEGRELEVSIYEYRGKVHASKPGEIILPKGSFYSYEEKYAPYTKAQTAVVAKGLSSQVIEDIQSYSLQIFQLLKLSDLARVDFFYSEDEGVFFNEVNTFPGLTPISMFPKMLENSGPSFQDFFQERLQNLLLPLKKS